METAQASLRVAQTECEVQIKAANAAVSEAESKAARIERKAEASEFKGRAEEAQEFREEAAAMVVQAKRDKIDIEIAAYETLDRKRVDSENEVKVAEEASERFVVARSDLVVVFR